MKFKNYIFAVFAFLLTSSEAFSHDAKLHKGKPVEGTITALKVGSFTLKGNTKEVPVELNKDTVIEAGVEGEAATLTDLKEKLPVKVFGTMLNSGVLVAKEIIISRPPSYSGKTQ